MVVGKLKDVGPRLRGRELWTGDLNGRRVTLDVDAVRRRPFGLRRCTVEINADIVAAIRRFRDINEAHVRRLSLEPGVNRTKDLSVWVDLGYTSGGGPSTMVCVDGNHRVLARWGMGVDWVEAIIMPLACIDEYRVVCRIEMPDGTRVALDGLGVLESTWGEHTDPKGV